MRISSNTPWHLSRLQVSLRAMFAAALAFLLFVLAALVINKSWQEQALEYEILNIRRGLKEIVSEVAQYHHKHGVLPFSKAGGLSALEEIRDNVEPEGLVLLSSGTLAYLNEQDAKLFSQQIVLAQDHGEGSYVATGDGTVAYIDTMCPSDVVVGGWLTNEGFVATCKNVFDDWNDTHSGRGPALMEYGPKDGKPSQAFFPDGTRIEYTYVEGMISRCAIISPSGQRTVEDIHTDQFGRIAAIHRNDQ